MTWLEWFWGTLERPIKIGDQTLAFSWLSIVLEWILPLLICFLVLFYVGRGVNKRIARMQVPDERKTRFSGFVKIGSRLIFAFVVILLSIRFLEDSILTFFQDFFQILGTPFYKSGTTQISVMTLILAVPVILVSNLGGKAARAALDRSKVFTHNLSESRRRTIANLLRYGVMVITLLLGLSIIGLDLTAIMILLGVFGVGIGFGLQNTLASFFAGLSIVVNRPFKEGDWVRVDFQGELREGTLKVIRMINSVILTDNHETLVIPNSILMNTGITNLSFHDQHFHNSLIVTVDHSEDIDRVREVIAGLVAACPLVLQDKAPVLAVLGMTAEGIEIDLTVKLQSPHDRQAVRVWLVEEIIRTFRKKQIKLTRAG